MDALRKAQDSWALLAEVPNPLLRHESAPLAGCGWLRGIVPAEALAAEISVTVCVNPKGVEPAFKNTSCGILLALRRAIQTGTDSDIVEAWAEKLLRFCEIRRLVLRERALEIWQNEPAGRLGCLEMGAFLLDHFMHVHDSRHLNLVLKLLDLPWLADSSRRRRSIGSRSEADVLAGLFRFRLESTVEHALEKLAKRSC